MPNKSVIIVAATLAVFAVAFEPRIVWGGQASDCIYGDKIDGSSADSARAKMEKAGFQHVHDLDKGCDSFWHGKADKDGVTVNMVLSPEGRVMVEGN